MERAERKAEESDLTQDRSDLNAESLAREITWFARVVNERLRDYFSTPVAETKEKEKEEPGWFEKIFSENLNKGNEQQAENTGTAAAGFSTAAPPDLAQDHSVYAEFVNYYRLSSEERLILMLAIIPHIQPHLLDVFFSDNKNFRPLIQYI